MLKRGKLIGNHTIVVMVAVHLQCVYAKCELSGIVMTQRTLSPAGEAVILLDNFVAYFYL